MPHVSVYRYCQIAGNTHDCTRNLDEEEQLVEDIVWSLQLHVTLKLGLDVLKDWLDCVAVRIACHSPPHHSVTLYNTLSVRSCLNYHHSYHSTL